MIVSVSAAKPPLCISSIESLAYIEVRKTCSHDTLKNFMTDLNSH